MTSVLNVDSIAAKDGTSPVGLTKQSAVRAYFQANLETPAVNESLNIASITDVAGGRHDFTYTSNFSSATYASATGGGGSTSNFTLANVSTPTDAKLTSKVRTDTMYAHGASYVFDPPACCVANFGDLA